MSAGGGRRTGPGDIKLIEDGESRVMWGGRA